MPTLLLLSSCKAPTRSLQVTFLDVGQGDGIVIESPEGKVVVIDGGGIPGTDEREGADPGNRIVVPFLRARGISSVDLLVPTHPDDDHVQGLIAVTERLTVHSVLTCGQVVKQDGQEGVGAYGRLTDQIKARHIPTFLAERGQTVPIDNQTTLEILHPKATQHLQGTRSDDNNNGIALRLVYKDTRILLMADLESEAEAALLRSGVAIDAQVIKVGHHGSRFSTTPAFLTQVHPQYAILSCGRNNRFGHPHTEVIDRLRAQNVAIYRTDQQGAITLVSDGTDITFQKIY
jgi:competence protein ComEC